MDTPMWHPSGGLLAAVLGGGPLCVGTGIGELHRRREGAGGTSVMRAVLCCCLALVLEHARC
jgi:hypothetical protein